MFTTMFPHSKSIRIARRNARRDIRIMAGNIKRAAASKGLHSIPALSLWAGVPLRRTALMWFGVTFTVSEMTRYLSRLDLTVSDLYAGTGSAA